MVVWIGFFALVALLLFIDLGVVNRKAHVVSMREAAMASVAWIAVGLSFSGLVWLGYEYRWGGLGLNTAIYGAQAWSEYLTAYLVEKSLSVDNIFVIAMLMAFFRVPDDQQHRVLFWGILGAIVFRGIMIAAGSALVQEFDWIFYVFGAILAYTAWRMLFAAETEVDPKNSRIVRFARKILPLEEHYHGSRFRVEIDGKKRFTLLFLVVVVVEATDIVFAVDSIPAIFGFTTEPFIVMSSNVFAILGLRALYFVVAGAMREFRYLKISVATILMLVAIKMFIHDAVHISAPVSLGVVVVILTLGIVASVLANRYARQHTSVHAQAHVKPPSEPPA
jgi:tellurite resistance protein TerC